MVTVRTPNYMVTLQRAVGYFDGVWYLTVYQSWPRTARVDGLVVLLLLCDFDP